jgi:molybdopterin converting factor small subunit
MNITVRYAAQLSRAAGVAEEVVALTPDATLAAVTRALCERHEADFRQLILDDAGALRPSVLVVVDGEQLAPGAPLTLRDGGELMLLTPMAGG